MQSSVGEILAELGRLGVSAVGIEDKKDLVDLANSAIGGLGTKYDLVASICHDSGSGTAANVTSADEK